jgi:hypothetical protein
MLDKYSNVFVGHNCEASLDLEHAIELTADFRGKKRKIPT